MKKNLCCCAAFSALMFSSSIAEADPLRIGFGGDVGIPSGISVGVVVHPKVDWVSVQLSITHNIINFGGRIAAKVDPLAYFSSVPVGIFGDFQFGGNFSGNIPSLSDFPTIGYRYINMYGGLRLGRPNGFHWNFEVGPSFIDVSTHNFQTFVNKDTANKVTVSEPKVSLTLTPTFITGFEVMWP